MNEPEERMTIELNLDDEGVVECEVITILEVNGKDYIALLSPNQNDKEEQEVWFYGYKENMDDSNEEPELIYIDNDEEYESVIDAFDEYLDNNAFDDM